MKVSDFNADNISSLENVEIAESNRSGKEEPFQYNGYEIPEQYGDNKIVLLVRDPWTIFSYWEIRKDVEDSIRNSIQEKGLHVLKSILRVYEVDSKQPDAGMRVAFDFELNDMAQTWYVNDCAPSKEWMAEIGILCSNGEFMVLARSNIVRTPDNGMSEISDSEWMCPEDTYYKMFAVAGGYDIGKSSLELKELIQQHLKAWRSSGGISSGMFGSAEMFRGKK